MYSLVFQWEKGHFFPVSFSIKSFYLRTTCPLHCTNVMYCNLETSAHSWFSGRPAVWRPLATPGDLYAAGVVSSQCRGGRRRESVCRDGFHVYSVFVLEIVLFLFCDLKEYIVVMKKTWKENWRDVHVWKEIDGCGCVLSESNIYVRREGLLIE